jgi:GT2 family glycosyltransferase
MGDDAIALPHSASSSDEDAREIILESTSLRLFAALLSLPLMQLQPMLKRPVPIRANQTAAAKINLWVRWQLERLVILGRALRPADDDARAIILESLRRRCSRHCARDESEAREAHEIDTARYHAWIRRFDELSRRDREAIEDHIAKGELPVPLAVLIFDSFSAKFAAAAVQHLRKQLLSHFDALLWFAPDSPPDAIASARRAIRGDARFTVLTAPCLDEHLALPQFDHVLLASGGVLLREHALYMFVIAAQKHTPCIVYSDEDYLDSDGVRCQPCFKPDFSPEFLRRTGYIGPCVLFRGLGLDVSKLLRGALKTPGTLESHIERLKQLAGRDAITHVPFVLYHDARPPRPRSALPDETCLPAEYLPSISIIIPTKDRLDLLEPCLESIRNLTIYPRARFEIVVVDNGSNDPDALAYLQQSAKSGVIRLLRDAGEFNYARLNNLAARQSTSDVLVFLNNDTLVDDPRWLQLLVSQAMQEDVAAVGAKLLYPDRTVQFGGTILGIQGVAGHAHVGLRENDGGYRGIANATHEVAAVTGACLAIRRKVFEEIGGFDTALAIACNDVLLCVEALERGYRNLYLARPLIVHLESKSRGFDDTQEKREHFLDEARYVRGRHKALFQNDPFYSPNLSYHRAYKIAVPPRRAKPWRDHVRRPDKLRILMLSIVHDIGHGVPVVLRLQATHLAQLGHEVIVGGPRPRRGVSYPGCQLAYLNDPADAAAYAVAKDIDCIVAHTFPFFSVVRWIGEWPRCILYDYGEPDPAYFADAEKRRKEQVEKRFCFAIAEHVFAISEAVRAKMDLAQAGIIRLGNSHLSTWSDVLLPRRERARAARNWRDKVVVLNVCRFQNAEREYKGIDIYAAIAKDFERAHPELCPKLVFVLCGKAEKEDVQEVEALGLSVVANVSDEELIDFYSAADIYMNFSRWEGYNLGIGQALALGLPVVASDIQAHREFGIMISNDPVEIGAELSNLVKAALAGELQRERRPRLWTWDEPLAAFAAAVETACR